MNQVWIITAVYGRCGKNLMFADRSSAKKWIEQNYSPSLIIQDNIRATKFYLDTPEKFDRLTGI